MIRDLTIDAAWLRAHGACERATQKVTDEWPAGAAVTRANLLRAAALGLDLDWLARRVLAAPASAEYERAMAPAWAEYERAMAPAREEYERATASAGEEYERAMAPAREEYERVTAPAREEYERATASALADQLGLT